MSVTPETIRKYERDEIGKNRPNVVLLATVANVLGCRLGDLDPDLEADVKTILGELVRSRCSASGQCVAAQAA